jgi:hypothetical protein
MKNKIIALFIPVVMLMACTSSSKNVTFISSATTDEDFIVFANYQEGKTAAIEQYLGTALHQSITLKDEVDFKIKLPNGETALVKSSAGQIEIIYHKKDGTAEGIQEMETLKNGLEKVL